MNTNPLVKHLLAFGKEIKKNGELLDCKDFQTSYKWRNESYEYLFKMAEKHGVELYEITVVMFLRHDKIIPLGSIRFTDDNIYPFMSGKDWVEIYKERKESKQDE